MMFNYDRDTPKRMKRARRAIWKQLYNTAHTLYICFPENGKQTAYVTFSTDAKVSVPKFKRRLERCGYSVEDYKYNKNTIVFTQKKCDKVYSNLCVLDPYFK